MAESAGKQSLGSVSVLLEALATHPPPLARHPQRHKKGEQTNPRASGRKIIKTRVEAIRKLQ